MSSLRRFLDWFEGFNENIEEQPTPKQWERIKAKVEDLYANVGEEPEPGMIAAHVPQAPKKPETPAQWKSAAKAFLIEHGFDPESADDILANVPVDLSVDPAIVARSAAGPLLKD